MNRLIRLAVAAVLGGASVATLAHSTSGGAAAVAPRPVARARALAAPADAGDDDVATVPSQDLHVAGNDKQRYFLIGAPPDKSKAPADGYGLMLVLPGGDGGADFNPFVRRIYQNALPANQYLVAQLVAVPAHNPKQIVWPTEKTKDPKQTFATESFINAVIKEVSAKQKVDARKVYALGWSSSGPAVYAAALAADSPLTGAFVAMSIFRPGDLPLTNAKGKHFFLLQSPQDQVTKYFFARAAKTQLERNGAAVKLVDYDGGHGWRGNVFGNLRSGVEWLEAQK